MIPTSSTTTTLDSMELEEPAGAGKDVIKRLTDILSGLRMQKEQLELRSSASSRLSSTYPASVSATILGVPQRDETDLNSLVELLAIGKESWNVLRIQDAASSVINEKITKKEKKNQPDAPAKKDIFDGYLNLAVVYMATGLERRDIKNFGELVTYLKDERADYSSRMGHICFISPPGPIIIDDEPIIESHSRDIDADSTDPTGQPSLKRSATVSKRESKKEKKKKNAAKKKKDILSIRTVSTWWAGGTPKEVTFGTFTDAATTAALLLLGDAWGISVEDLLVLCQANLRSIPLEEQYLIDEAQSRRDRHQSLNSTYVHHPSYKLGKVSATAGGNAMCFSYPETPPRFSSDLLMSVYQPHAAPPTRFGYAVWGSSAMIRPRRSTVMTDKTDDPTPYKGVMILPEAMLMEKHVRMLRDMARQPLDIENELDPEGIEMEPVFLTWLKSHWIHAAAPTLVAETQNVLQTLSEAPLWLERIRFESTTGASSGRANYLLMLYHHFRQSAFLAKRMKRQIEDLRATIPPSVTAGLQSTAWLGSISEDCDFWFSECDRLCKDTGLLRRFVLEQRELTQSTRGFVLTILASIFIPLSFVATFFGMNTIEINSPQSNWKLKYYFWSAIPLVIATVFTPFIVPPALRWAVRSGANFVSRPVAKFVVITLSMVYFVASDVTCLRIDSAFNKAYDGVDFNTMSDAEISKAVDRIHKQFEGQTQKCETLNQVNTWFRICIAVFAVGFCWFEIDHRRTINPERKTRPWPVSVLIAHFRWTEGWRRMYLYYLTTASFATGLSLGIPLLYLIPYFFYFWKVGVRAYRKYRDRRDQQRISKRVKDMEINGNLERRL